MSHDKQHRLLQEAWKQTKTTIGNRSKRLLLEYSDREELLIKIEDALGELQVAATGISNVDGLMDILSHVNALVDSAKKLEEIYQKTAISKVKMPEEEPQVPEAF